MFAITYANRDAEPVARTVAPVPPPPQVPNGIKLGPLPAPQWSAARALDGADLYAEYERAVQLNRADGWFVARTLADRCGVLVNDAAIAKLIDDETIRAAASADMERMHTAEQRRVALTGMQGRCAGFKGKGAHWTHKTMQELQAKIVASDSDLGRMYRAREELREGRMTQWEQAVSAVLFSGDAVRADEAMAQVAGMLYDARLPPPKRPDYNAASLLRVAWARVAGTRVISELDRQTVCIMSGQGCGIEQLAFKPEQVPEKERKAALDLLAQYEAALQDRDLHRVLTAQPAP
jgi:hypothetical protein